jgi:hypothetical protein
MYPAVGHQYRLGADHAVIFRCDADQAFARLQGLGDCGLDGGKTRITPQKHRYRNKVSQLAAQRYYGGLPTQRFHE